MDHNLLTDQQLCSERTYSSKWSKDSKQQQGTTTKEKMRTTTNDVVLVGLERQQLPHHRHEPQDIVNSSKFRDDISVDSFRSAVQFDDLDNSSCKSSFSQDDDYYSSSSLGNTDEDLSDDCFGEFTSVFLVSADLDVSQALSVEETSCSSHDDSNDDESPNHSFTSSSSPTEDRMEPKKVMSIAKGFLSERFEI